MEDCDTIACISASSCGSVLISVEQVCTSRRGIESGFLKSTMSKLVLREKGYCPACTRRNVPPCKLCNLFLVNRLLRDKMIDISEFGIPWTKISKHCQRWWIVVGCILKTSTRVQNSNTHFLLVSICLITMIVRQNKLTKYVTWRRLVRRHQDKLSPDLRNTNSSNTWGVSCYTKYSSFASGNISVRSPIIRLATGSQDA